MELLKTMTMEEARQLVYNVFSDIVPDTEEVELLQSLDRIISQDIVSLINVPEFNRSTVDGYAVISKDTSGASEALPGFLQSIGEAEMGKETDFSIQSGQCCYVPTGGMLPRSSDSVVMIEYTEILDENTVCVQRPAAPGENVLKAGDDVIKGQVLFKKGHKLRPQDIGLLSGIGFTRVSVYEKLPVSIISTGDEIAAPEEELKPGQIKDMNTYSLAAALMKDGCHTVATAVVRDDLLQLKEKIKEYLTFSKIVLISGGSSMGVKDITKDAINELGEPGVFIHGIAVKPGKPTIAGKINDKAVFGLPGQPVSALVIYQVLVRDLIKRLYGDQSPVPYLCGEMGVNIASAAGREHYVMVNISRESGKETVYPVHGKSGMLTTMAKAAGYIKIATNQEGVEKGQKVNVYLL